MSSCVSRDAQSSYRDHTIEVRSPAPYGLLEPREQMSSNRMAGELPLSNGKGSLNQGPCQDRHMPVNALVNDASTQQPLQGKSECCAKYSCSHLYQVVKLPACQPGESRALNSHEVEDSHQVLCDGRVTVLQVVMEQQMVPGVADKAQAGQNFRNPDPAMLCISGNQCTARDIPSGPVGDTPAMGPIQEVTPHSKEQGHSSRGREAYFGLPNYGRSTGASEQHNIDYWKARDILDVFSDHDEVLSIAKETLYLQKKKVPRRPRKAKAPLQLAKATALRPSSTLQDPLPYGHNQPADTVKMKPTCTEDKPSNNCPAEDALQIPPAQPPSTPRTLAAEPKTSDEIWKWFYHHLQPVTTILKVYYSEPSPGSHPEETGQGPITVRISK